MRDTPNVGSIASWRINVKKYVWACGLTALFLGSERFPNWLFSGSEPISDGIRTAWSRYSFDEIINCGIITQLISHFLSVASLPYATFVLAINVIGAESKYLTGHCDPSDIDTLRTHCLAVLVMAAWAYEKARSCRPKSPTLRSGLLLGCLEMTHDPYLVASDLVGSGVEVGAKHV